MIRHGSPATMLHLHHEHPRDVSPTQARETQQRLRRLVETADRLGDIGTVAGVDVGFDLRNGLAHPRRFGIACHLGVLTEMASMSQQCQHRLGAACLELARLLHVQRRDHAVLDDHGVTL